MEKWMRLTAALLLTATCCGFAGVCHAADDPGAGVVAKMHAKYQNRWFATTAFVQKTTTYDDQDKASVESWYERIQLPGKLRIDIGPVADGNAIILSDGQLHTFKHGTRVDNRPTVSLALLLGFDVYRQPPGTTLALLRQEGVDTASVHGDFWQGRPVLVVGAARNDLRPKQFWVDKKRLLVLRILEPSRNDPATPSDIRFLDLRKQARGVIAARIEVYRQDRLVMSEEYSDIEIDMPLDAAWFDPSKLQTPGSRN
jgi:hypothetical protein